jgi:hypothetical protein
MLLFFNAQTYVTSSPTIVCRTEPLVYHSPLKFILIASVPTFKYLTSFVLHSLL